MQVKVSHHASQIKDIIQTVLFTSFVGQDCRNCMVIYIHYQEFLKKINI